MIRSRLFHRLFSTMLIVVGSFSAAVYLLVVPLVQSRAYTIELNASGAILDNVFTMATKIKGGLEEQRSLTEASYKQQLRSIVQLASGYVDWVFGQRDRGEISDSEARRLVFEGLRSMKYGRDDYIWVTDYYSNLLSHPDPELQGKNAADFRDQSGNTIIPMIISTARAWGEGFHTYPWRRAKGGSTEQKISYFRDLPEHRLVVGTGAYLADIDAEVERRKAMAIEDLRQVLRAIRIGVAGYVYIFDARNNMVIHPNPNIEGSEFSGLTNPQSGRSIADELKAAADSGEPVYYLWDKPSDPGHYVYQKISWVRHFSGFDWYIASSVYVEDLRRSAEELSNRIIWLTILILLVGITMAWMGARRLVRPLRRLVDTAAQVQAGDLTARTGISSEDEIGILAAGLDTMIDRVQDNIATLDSRVRERTIELEDSNRRLQTAIGQQNRAQAALAETEARQRLILDAIPAAIAYLDRDQTIRFANQRWADLMRRDKSEVTGRLLADVVGRSAHGVLAPYLDQTHQGAPVTFEYAFPFGDDSQNMVTKNTLIPELANGEASGGMFVLSLDVTAERETERRLMEAQRLNAVGQLSGGLAHDFNNLLSIIIGNLAAARERYGNVAGLDDYLEPAQRAGRRGADITSRLLAFSRRQPLKPQPVDVALLIRDMAVLLRRSLPSSIQMDIADEGLSCWAIADPNQLENALVNLALNAKDAMPDGGRLGMSAAIRVLDQPEQFDEMAPAGDYLCIQVEDSGHGFEAGTAAHAFEPFFTTKEGGSGLGLSMVYGFVKQSHGFIRIDSRPGAGAVVTILLPRAEPVSQDQAPVSAKIDQAWPGRLALVAEDNADVRRVMRRQLVELGFSVVEAESGDEAWDLAQQIDGLHLVVSDIVMPGLSGTDLAKRLKAARPEIGIVLISGFAMDDSVVGSDIIVLGKPWDKRDLIDAIAKLGEATG
ncbi:cache domain-containing protein [Magnetospirillum moscoviense]|uniref:histidine kinase n=1 Tax=Magnetospirillum moscoviense TaxID=1437059 RepID=A0A178MR01_9PROT|nr:cache domain-containing protein [Magnetospirillum moscoviense]OAN51489.1 histidine kinase [Magnetospirillum moscoviense]